MKLSSIKFLFGSQFKLNRLIPSIFLKIPFGKLKGCMWFLNSGPLEMAFGIYERNKISLMKFLLGSGQVFYDVGAHTGYYSILASKLVGEKGFVYAFEPSQRNLSFLKLNLGLNSCKNVKIINACVGDRTGLVDFNSGPNSTMGHIGKGDLKVKMVSLDYLFKNIINPPDLIKIDVEGAENLVLYGSRKLLKLFKPKILLAIHSEELYLQCSKFLKDLNYKVILIAGKACSKELLAT